jgi:hypothetical protein
MKEKQPLIKTKLLKPFTAAYFLIAAIEIIAEFFKDSFFIAISKPLLMPLLLVVYWCSSKDSNRNRLFILALFLVFIANIFFISNAMQYIVIGSLFFLLYRILIIWVVFKIVKFPGYFPLIIGALPFLFVYLFVANVTYQVLGNKFYLFILQGIFLIFFGGFCLGSYIIKSNTSNTYLLISTMLFTATQFILVIKIFYVNFNFLQPLAMLLFVIGQYLLYRFIVIEEKKKKRYLIINKAKSSELN